MGQIKYLNGLKGIGALMVFFCHYNLMRFPMPSWLQGNPYVSLLSDGGFAVALFVIISGFTAWLSVERKISDRKLIAQMIVNRYFRFAIPFGMAFFLMYILWHVGVFEYHLEAGMCSGSETLKNAFWPISFSGFIKALLLSPISADFWDAPLWMMKYIFLGTYLAILLRLGIGGMSRKYQIVTLAFTLCLFAIGDIFYLGIMLGILFSYFYKVFPSNSKTKWGGGLLLLLFLMMRWQFPFSVSTEMRNFMMATILLFAIYLLPVLQRILEMRLFQYLGKISFSIYIFHWPIMGALTSFLYVKTLSLAYWQSLLLVYGITIVAVLVVSHFSEKLICVKSAL